jgi:hypothetical protein
MRTASVNFLVLALAIAPCLVACSRDNEDQIADRLEQEMRQAGRGTSDAERREVAEALASDAVSIGKESAAIEAATAEMGNELEATHGTVNDIKAEECANLRLVIEKLEQIQRDPTAGEPRTEGELAALPGELEQVRSRQRELCSP